MRVEIRNSQYEYQALLGMKQLLSVNRPVLVMELWPWGLREAGASTELVIKFFEEHEYHVSLVDEKRRETHPLVLQELKNSENDYYDILCEPCKIV